jgi:SAM-dependent methyltransferase
VDDQARAPCRDPAETDKQEILGHFKTLFGKHGVTASSLDWRPSSQVVRFEAVLANFGNHPPESLIDVGCGFGDLLSFLRKAGWTGGYLGIDLMPEFVEIARERHKLDPDASFMVGNAITQELPVKDFDWCVSIGLCNYQREVGAKAFIEALIGRCVSLARRRVLIDFLSTTSDRRRDDLFFSDPADVITSALRHSSRVVLDHSYMPFEFMLRIHLDNKVAPGEPYFSAVLSDGR